MLIRILFLVLLTAPVAQAQNGALKRYVDAPDKSYGFVEREKGAYPGVEYVELTLTSQTWKNIPWRHRLFVIRPTGGVQGKQALMMIAGGSWHDDRDMGPLTEPKRHHRRELAIMSALATRLRTPVAVLLNVPRQPMLEGRKEDALIALTFDKYLTSGDETWPLLLPMTKSAVRAMDAVQAYASRHWKLTLESFTVTGASKRGWTTWLTAAVDSRVTAIAPMVIDMLNIAPQMKHQVQTFGEYSNKIHDYTERNLQQRLSSDDGKKLRQIVDPYAYRDRIRQPKIVLLGTNDRYWPVDALNLYWEGLTGPKYITYVPNQGHNLRDLVRVSGAVAAIHRQASGDLTLPKLTWRYGKSDRHATLQVTSDIAPQGGQMWSATSDSRDFRDATWSASPLTGKDGHHRCSLPKPKSGYAAMFAELRFTDGAWPYFLSTTINVIEPPTEGE